MKIRGDEPVARRMMSNTRTAEEFFIFVTLDLGIDLELRTYK